MVGDQLVNLLIPKLASLHNYYLLIVFSDASSAFRTASSPFNRTYVQVTCTAITRSSAGTNSDKILTLVSPVRDINRVSAVSEIVFCLSE